MPIRNIGRWLGLVDDRPTGAGDTAQRAQHPAPGLAPSPAPRGVAPSLVTGRGGVGGVVGGQPLTHDVGPMPASAFDPMIMGREPGERRGEQLWQAMLAESGHRIGTPQFDKWVLQFDERPDDPEFSAVLREHQKRARNQERIREAERRRKEREQAERQEVRAAEGARGRFGMGRDVRDIIAEANRPVLEELERRQPTTVLLGPDGERMPQQFRITRDGRLESFGAQELDPMARAILAQEDDPVARAELEREFMAGEGGVVLHAGEYLWMGDVQVDAETGRETNAFMAAQDAMHLPYHWSMDQVMYAQEAFGMDPTGFVDPTLIRAWTGIVDTAAGYTQAGRNLSPMTLLDMMHSANEAARAGAGGAGGRGGVRAFDRSESTAVLNRAFRDEAGREASSDEAAAFHAALNNAGMDVDPFQFAIDWVRAHAGGEAASVQVATDYYQAMMAVMGTMGSEAAGGGQP